MLVYLKLLLTAFFWGGTFIAGRMIAGSVHPVSAAFIRFAIATLFLVVMTIRLEGRLPRVGRGQLLPVFLSGLTGVFAYNILFFTGLKHISAGRASLIIATNPIFISLLSALIFKEKLTRIKAVGIVLSVAGAMLVISNGRLTDIAGYDIGLGELLIFGCVLSWVSYSLCGKVVMGSLSPLASVTYSSIVGTALLAVPAGYTGIFSAIGGYALQEWGCLFYLGFFGTVLGFFWYYQGIQHIGPMKASVFINFVPVSAILLAFVLLDESLTLSLFTGGALVIAGVYVSNFSDRLERHGVRIMAALKPSKG